MDFFRIPALFILKVAVYCIPGGARHVGDNDPLLPQDPVGQRGLAHIGLADEGHLDDVVVLLFLLLRGEVVEAGVQQIAGAMSVNGGDGDGVPKAQVVELVNIRVQIAHLIHFVYRQYHRLLGAQQHIGHILVGGGQAGLDVTHKDDHRSRLNGDLRLLPHKRQNLVVGTRLDTACVNDVKGAAPPVTLGIQAIPGDAGGVLHNGQPLTAQLVKQHGFAHIGPTHDCN